MNPGTEFWTPLQSGSKIEPQRCQVPRCAVISLRGPRLPVLSLVPTLYVSSQPTQRMAPEGQPPAAGVQGEERVLQARGPDLLEAAIGDAVHVPDQVGVLVVVVGRRRRRELADPRHVRDADVAQHGGGRDGDDAAAPRDLVDLRHVDERDVVVGVAPVGRGAAAERLLEGALRDVRRGADFEAAHGQSLVARLAEAVGQLGREAQVEVEQAHRARLAVDREVLVVGEEQRLAVGARDREGVRLGPGLDARAPQRRRAALPREAGTARQLELAHVDVVEDAARRHGHQAPVRRDVINGVSVAVEAHRRVHPDVEVAHQPGIEPHGNPGPGQVPALLRRQRYGDDERQQRQHQLPHPTS